MPVRFEISADRLSPSLRERMEGVELTPLHKSIAEMLFRISQESFRKEESPSGEEWAPLSAATFELSFRKRYGDDAQAYKRVGGQKQPTSKFQGYIQRKRSRGILQESGTLRRLATAADEEGARIGSNQPQARIQQLGSDGPMKGFIKSELLARPYVGMGEKDKSVAARMVANHYRDRLEGN